MAHVRIGSSARDPGIVDFVGNQTIASLFGDLAVTTRKDVVGVLFANGILPRDVVRVERWDITSPSGTLQLDEMVEGGTSGALGLLRVATTPVQIFTLSGQFEDLETITGRESAATAVINRGTHGTITSDESRCLVSSGTNADTDVRAESRRVVSYTPGHDAFMFATAGWLDGGLAGADQFLFFGHEEDGYSVGLRGLEFGIMHTRDGVDDFIPLGSAGGSAVLDPLNGAGESRFELTGALTAGLLSFGVRFGYLGTIGATFFVHDDVTRRWIPFYHHALGSLDPKTVVLDPRFRVGMRISKVAAGGGVLRMIGGSWNAGTLTDSPFALKHFFNSAELAYTTSGPKPAFTIRNKQSFGGIRNRRPLLLTRLNPSHDGVKKLEVTVWKNAVLVGGTFVDHDTLDSFVEVRVPTSFTGGTLETARGLGRDGDASDDIRSDPPQGGKTIHG